MNWRSAFFFTETQGSRNSGGLEQRLGKLLWVERLKVFRLFAQANKFDRQTKLLLNRDDHTALAGSIQLRHNQAREGNRFVEFACLVQCVHSSSRVQHQQDFV